MFMLRLRHAPHSASHRMQREPLNLKAELGVILCARGGNEAVRVHHGAIVAKCPLL